MADFQASALNSHWFRNLWIDTPLILNCDIIDALPSSTVLKHYISRFLFGVLDRPSYFGSTKLRWLQTSRKQSSKDWVSHSWPYGGFEAIHGSLCIADQVAEDGLFS